jgi:hypothetical protein
MPQNQAKNGEGRQAIVLLAAIVAFAVLGLVVVLRNRWAASTTPRAAQTADAVASPVAAPEPPHVNLAPGAPPTAASPVAAFGVGARARIQGTDKFVTVSSRPDRWGDADSAGRLALGTDVVVLEERQFPNPVGSPMRRFRVAPASKKGPTGWVWGADVGAPEAERPAEPAAATPEVLPPGVVLMKPDTVVAVTKPLLERAYALAEAGDSGAFNLYVKNTPGVMVMPLPTKVSIVDAGVLGPSKVRVYGTLQEVWVKNDRLQLP